MLFDKARGGMSEVCGTRGYWAPEMIRRDANGKRSRYTETVDWFSYGCCVYEFLVGVCPFRTDKAKCWKGFDPKKDKDKAIDAATLEMEPDFSSDVFDPKARDFCEKLLNKDGKTRLGARGAEQVKAHPWFEDVNWALVSTGKEKPPFLPGRDINMYSQSEIGMQYAL